MKLLIDLKKIEKDEVVFVRDLKKSQLLTDEELNCINCKVNPNITKGCTYNLTKECDIICEGIIKKIEEASG